jgi:hypothetical protein
MRRRNQTALGGKRRDERLPLVEAFATVQEENRRSLSDFEQFEIDVCDFGHPQAYASQLDAVWFCRAAARSLCGHGGITPG